MSLRDHLLAAQAASTSPGAELQHGGNSALVHEQQQGQQTQQHTPLQPQGPLDASQLSPSPYVGSPIATGMEPQNPDVRKGRRELSTSKRAAQNRAAQRAFRQRKEQYITTLKSQVANFEQMATGYKNLEQENLTLREYIIMLQSRLLEAGHSEFPPAPVDLTRPSQRVTAAAAAAAAAVAAAESEHQRSQQALDEHQDHGHEQHHHQHGDEQQHDTSDDLRLEAQLQAAAAAAEQRASEIGGHHVAHQHEQDGHDEQGLTGDDLKMDGGDFDGDGK